MSSVFNDAIKSFLSPIGELLDDESVSEVMINGPDEIFVEQKGLVFKVENTFPNEDALVSAMRAIAQSVGRVIDEDKEQQEGKKVQEVQTKEEESMPIVDNEEKPSTMVILCTLNEQKSSSTTNATFMVETRQEAFDLLNELSLAVTNQ